MMLDAPVTPDLLRTRRLQRLIGSSARDSRQLRICKPWIGWTADPPDLTGAGIAQSTAQPDPPPAQS